MKYCTVWCYRNTIFNIAVENDKPQTPFANAFEEDQNLLYVHVDVIAIHWAEEKKNIFIITTMTINDIYSAYINKDRNADLNLAGFARFTFTEDFLLCPVLCKDEYWFLVVIYKPMDIVLYLAEQTEINNGAITVLYTSKEHRSKSEKKASREIHKQYIRSLEW
eukprot:scaffold3670_cov193-Ochromonas_danica.AAC.1